MKRIEEKIHSIKPVSYGKDKFINKELEPSAKTFYVCRNCKTENEIEIEPYKTGFPFFEIYRNKLIDESIILDSGMASKSIRQSEYLGEYLVLNLPTLYFKTSCKNCNSDHMVVFGCGESQPGKQICKISGVWNIPETTKLL
ncbi:hypothetical protein [Aquimarina spongiae]|uniref:Uncharacterized protein n=1 Tax=Aquimarina spongiae TaxID=570521 RepID=A0A1M6JNG0_9FLAO|nr:hypothetical protein [Aquimarina spongiae]SHJ48168.1 hypothetical protein SAMN04488508_109158 [Aquimarina spongiae]